MSDVVDCIISCPIIEKLIKSKAGVKGGKILILQSLYSFFLWSVGIPYTHIPGFSSSCIQ